MHLTWEFLVLFLLLFRARSSRLYEANILSPEPELEARARSRHFSPRPVKKISEPQPSPDILGPGPLKTFSEPEPVARTRHIRPEPGSRHTLEIMLKNEKSLPPTFGTGSFGTYFPTRNNFY